MAIKKNLKKNDPNAHKSDPEIIKKRREGRTAAYTLMKQMAFGDAIKIEKTPPPMPTIRFNVAEVVAYKDKLRKTVDKIPVGGAFIIPTKLKVSTSNYLKAIYNGDYQFKFFMIPDNTDMTRVYKLAK